MEAWIIDLLERFGLAGIFLLLVLETVFPPIPSEVILAFGGFLTTRTALTLPGVILWATLGSCVGAALLYLLGAWLGEERLLRLADRIGPRIRLRGEDLSRAIAWYRRYQSRAVFLCRMVPVLRSLISLPAGLFRMPFFPFLLLTAFGSLLWNTLLSFAGAALGEAWPAVLAAVERYSAAMLVLLFLATAAAAIFFFFKRRKKADK